MRRQELNPGITLASPGRLRSGLKLLWSWQKLMGLRQISHFVLPGDKRMGKHRAYGKWVGAGRMLQCLPGIEVFHLFQLPFFVHLTHFQAVQWM